MIDSTKLKAARGASLVELVTTLAVLVLVTFTVTVYSVDWVARERGRGESAKLMAYMQTARMEAVSRNRPCILVLDTASRSLRVMDSAGTSDLSDDILISQMALNDRLTFESPVSGPGPVTLSAGSGSTYLATFQPDGTVPSGAGFVSMRSGSRYDRVTLFVAGAAKLERWNGSAWSQGS